MAVSSGIAKPIYRLAVSRRTAMDKVVEDVTINKQAIQLIHDDVPVDRIELDENNPRIRYRLKFEMNGKGSVENVILGLPEVKLLKKDIEANGGLRERVMLQENGNGKFKAVEGNCRMVCVQSLRAKHKDDPRWKTVPARILPKGVDPKQIAILLSDFHVAGKITWDAHEKAGQVYYMVNDLKMSQDDVATYMRTSKTNVNRLLQAYAFLQDRFFKIDESRYAKEAERKWSYFLEFFKQKALREELQRSPEFGDEFCRWVGEGRIPEGADVRDLPSILRYPDAIKKLRTLEKDIAYAEARKVIEQTEPERASDFFKLLLKFRESCKNAAQVKEILRIRHDKVARTKVLETYEAFVDFMKLADLEPPEAKN
jgi:hypothetical protein